MSDVLEFNTEYALREHNLTRVYAVQFAWNPVSNKVLEKAGYRLEGRKPAAR